MNLSIVIPVYNEEDNINALLEDILNVFPNAEVIVVNDASTDKTLDLMRDFYDSHSINLRILTNKRNQGHGYSVIRALRAASAENILYIDADRQISLWLTEESKKYAIVSGHRIKRKDKLFRKVISFCLKMTILFRYGYYVKDANCPFKIYKKSAILPLLSKLPHTYIVPIAALEVLARKAGLKVITITTPHLPYNGIREGKLQSVNKVSTRFFFDAFMEMISL